MSSTETSESPPSEGEFILIANFEVCNCTTAELAAKHCSIDVSRVDLHSITAVAISYTYGEFSRRFVPIGHVRNDPSKRITLELGMEWNTEQILTRFVELSKEHGGIWLDQICITQQPKEIRAMLSKIPLIYQTLPVIVLLPGSHCQCLPNAVREFEEGRGHRVQRYGKTDLFLPRYANHCYNLLGASSYFDRLWTRQESLYATEISVLWCSPDLAPCADPEEFKTAEGSAKHIDNLAPFVRYVYQAELSQALSKKENSIRLQSNPEIQLVINPHLAASVQLHDLRNSTMDSLGKFIEQRNLRYISNIYPNAMQTDMAAFLLGRKLKNRPLTTNSVRHDFDKFIETVAHLGLTNRRATVKRDYILAIWADCSHFSLPPTYRELKAEVLLETVLRDYENKVRFWVVTYLPAGLFQNVDTFRWCPSLYVREANIQSSRDLYESISHVHQASILMPGGYFAFRMKSSIPPSRLTRAKNYRTEMSHLSTNEALNAMRNVWKNVRDKINPVQPEGGEDEGHWTLAEYILEDGMELEEFPHPDVGRYAFILKLAQPEKYSGGWKGLPEIDHCDVVYRLVSRLFALDHQLCLSRGLQVMIIPEEPAYIGLTRLQDTSYARAVSTVSIVMSEWFLRSPKSPAKQDPLNSLVYEVTRADDVQQSHLDEKIAPEHKAFPRYSVIGVWLVSTLFDHDFIGRDLDSERIPYNTILI